MRLERRDGSDNEEHFMSRHPVSCGEPMVIFNLGDFYS